MKQSGDLDLKIFREISKLSEIEFLGVLRFLNISIVEETNPIHQQETSSLEESGSLTVGGEAKANPKTKEEVDAVTTEKIDLIDNKLDDSRSPRAFQDLIEDLGVTISKLNRRQKRNLYKLIYSVTKKRKVTGNQNFFIKEEKE